VLIDGLHADGTPSTHSSQLANAYGVVYFRSSAPAAHAIARHLVGLKNAMGVSTFPNLLLALHELGRDDALVAAITDPHRPGYARVLAEGGTYIWESWDARQTGDSESHAWGSPVLDVLQDDVLGVRAVGPGAARLAIAMPSLHLRASGTVVTERGRVPISWRRDRSGAFSLAFTIPANVVATVDLPARRASDVREHGRNLGNDPGIRRVGPTPAGHLRLVVGSGHFEFRSA
jgi:alpha-L-rhamnosidase